MTMPEAENMSENGTGSEESRRVAMTDKLRQRETERQKMLEAKRQAREASSAENENVLLFTCQFKTSCDNLTSRIEESTSKEKASLPSHFDSINTELQQLTKFLADSKIFLPSYDLRKSQERIDELSEKLNLIRSTLIPKKKFGFKKEKKNSSPPVASIVSGDGDHTKSTSELGIQAPVEVDEGDRVIADRRDARICLTDVDNRVVGLVRVQDSDLFVRGSPSAMHVRDLINCRVIVGPTSGSIFIDRCQNCSFVVACQQLRIHRTHSTRFYTHVTSKAIIEDCTTASFAPYDITYPGLDEDYATSGLDRNRNNWNLVDDFDFLASGASPNWRLMDQSEAVVNWNEHIEKLITEHD